MFLRQDRFLIKIILKLCVLIILFIGSINTFSLINHLLKSWQYFHDPVDVYLVLGGSITREIYVSKIRENYPQIPIIISQGSQDPCILLIFKKEKVNIDNVWLEKCANSTFDNFFFSISLLKKWQKKHVFVITSDTHFPRAKLMAKIALLSQGFAVTVEGIPEFDGIPANHENIIKTILDVTRTMVWAWFGQFINPVCHDIIPLSDVDLRQWYLDGFACESRRSLQL